jgi:drug/metabolite transporter (DMT)-like permease
MYIELLCKVVSESLLSLYPVFVKNINIPLHLQLWSRFITYIIITSLFIDWGFISKTLFSNNGILLSVITIIHVYTSYRGFQLLESGIAYSLFYTYPIMILLISGEHIHIRMLLAIVGVLLLAIENKSNMTSMLSNIHDKNESKPIESFAIINHYDPSEPDSKISIQNSYNYDMRYYSDKRLMHTQSPINTFILRNSDAHSERLSPEKLPIPELATSIGVANIPSTVVPTSGIATEAETIPYEGYIMIVLAALTEAIIYFIVRSIKTTNNWNHLFLSYFIGTFIFTFIGFNEITKITISSNLSISLLINAVIGLCGYLLRFYAATRLDPSIYAPLSYIGIVMAYIYGFIFNGERITIQKLIGTVCIIVSIITTKK